MSEYDRILEELNTDCIANYVISCNYGKPIEEIYYRIQEEYIKHTSTEWFSGDLVLLYPSIKERHATRFSLLSMSHVLTKDLYILITMPYL